jgi:HlyD family secretion protein
MMRSRRTRQRLGAPALVLVLVAAGCGGSREQDDDKVEARVPVITQLVTVRDVDFTVTMLGTVEAWRKVTVSAKTSGQIVELNFEKGQTVSPEGADGEGTEAPVPLAVLEQEEYKLRWLEAEAALTDAKTTYERTKRLYEQGGAVQSEFDTAKSLFEVAQARRDLAKKAYDDTVVYSPIAGTVVSKPVEAGELVSPGTPLATVVDVHKVKIITSVSESDSPYVKAGQVCPVRIDALPDRTFSGTVIYKSITADPMTRAFPVELEVDNADRALAIGMVARVTFTLRTEPDAITVPLDALIYWENTLGVFVVEDEATAAFRPLTLGERKGDTVVVVDGLSAAEELVVVGQAGLRPGSKVTRAQQDAKKGPAEPQVRPSADLEDQPAQSQIEPSADPEDQPSANPED